MSNITEILATLAEAKEALEAKPRLEAEIASLNDSLNISNERRHEQTDVIISLNAKINELLADKARLEVERDEATFRSQVADHETKLAQDVVARMVALGQDYLASVVPAQPVVGEALHAPTNEAMPQSVGEAQGQSDSHPTVSTTQNAESPPAPTTFVEKAESVPSTTSSEAGEATGPFVTSSEHGGDTANVPTGSVETGVLASTPKPYSGQSWWNKPSDIPWADWVAGGGAKSPYV